MPPTPLEESIEHWTRLANGVSADDEGIHSNHCALCSLYYNKADPNDKNSLTNQCHGCPVKAKTGKSECQDTPWHIVSAIWVDDLKKGFCRNQRKLTPDFLAAAKEQLMFLQSLLSVTVDTTKYIIT